MHPEAAYVAAAADRLHEHFGPPPRTAVVLGSGLGGVVDRLETDGSADYGSLSLPESGVQGHAGTALVGRIGPERLVLLSGRVHLYEGHPAGVVVRYVRALKRWGVERLILTCSVGAIRSDLAPGRLVVVSDHINLQRVTPLEGPAYGTRFPDMTAAYDPALREALHAAGRAAGISLAEGVLAATPGPAYETPAEVRALRTLGADLVGMSTVPEILAAAEVGLHAAVVAVVANAAAGLSDGPLTHDEVTSAASVASAHLADLLEELCRGDR